MNKMLDRNEKRDILLNDHPLYRKKLEDKGLKYFRYYSTMKIPTITSAELADLTIIDYIYKTGDSLRKIAHNYYGDVRYWWVLATFNKKPIDNLIKVGDIIHVPMPLAEVMYLLTRDD